MKIQLTSSKRGIAMIIVMVVILVLGILAGGFAYSMKVETKLAKNASTEADIEWLGRSGVELAKYVLGQQLTLTPMFTTLNQKWAGGIGNTNDLLAWVTIENNHLGAGVYSVKIVDLERKLNLNMATQEVLQQAFGLLGVDVRDSSAIVDAILDWRDQDDNARLSGAESDDYYLRQTPPYFAKNGPIGDISELLLVRGITPEVFFGFGEGLAANGPGYRTTPATRVRTGAMGFGGATLSGVGLVDLFTASGGPLININTAPAHVLQLVPGVDEFMAGAILQARSGFDGQEGTEDDVPFANVGELNRFLNLPPTFVQQLQRFCQVHSFTFEVSVQVQVDRYRRQLKALLRRVSANDVQTLHVHWE